MFLYYLPCLVSSNSQEEQPSDEEPECETSQLSLSPSEPSGPTASVIHHDARASSHSSTTSATPSPLPPTTRSHKRKGEPDAVDVAILEMLKDKKSAKPEDEEGLFGMQLAAKMRKLSEHQKAVVKLRIQEVLLDVEFGYQFQNSSQQDPSLYVQ